MDEQTVKDAARYRWWRENIGCIEADGDGLQGVAFSCQIDLLSRDYTPAELMDLIADGHLPADVRDPEPEDECPNCVSPWKCNGPHVGDAPKHGYGDG